MIVDIVTSIIERGRRLLSLQPGARSPDHDLKAMCLSVLQRRGEATALAAASVLVDRLNDGDAATEEEFYRVFAHELGVDRAAVLKAAAAYEKADSWRHLQSLMQALEPPRQELLRRLNMVPGGTRAIIGLRERLLPKLASDPAMAAVDADFLHLLSSWFNRGFLTLQRISWDSPASLLDKIKKYEAVHPIADWHDLQRRLDVDRRCFAFFHPALEGEPLIFIEIALRRELSSSIQEILDQASPRLAEEAATHAIFFSISNCQMGLRGVSFGHFLIKQVVVELQQELPNLQVFSTLSPIPNFRKWLSAVLAGDGLEMPETIRAGLRALCAQKTADLEDIEPYKDVLLTLCARFLGLNEVPPKERDPVAKFHLGNGARLERLNWAGDISANGLAQSFGILVNYFYDLASLEENHEAFYTADRLATSSQVAKLLTRKIEAAATATRRKAIA
jgi:malonyl-CoA decarboxylase